MLNIQNLQTTYVSLAWIHKSNSDLILLRSDLMQWPLFSNTIFPVLLSGSKHHVPYSHFC